VVSVRNSQKSSCSPDKDRIASLHDTLQPTPLVELRSLSKQLGCRVVAKCEFLHPGGSVKDRAAHALLKSVEKTGELKQGGTVVQGSGGNTGISLAMLCAAKGYKAHITIPENISPDKISLLKMLGAEVTICECLPFSDPGHYAHQATAICKRTPGAVLPDQFENVANSQAHFDSTGPEIWTQSGGKVDAFVCAAGTGGTLAGVSRYLKGASNGHVQCFLVDPTGSGLKKYVETGVFSSVGGCFIDGIGIMRKTANFATAKVDGALRADDKEAVEMCYYLMRNEGIWVGPSAALNVVGAVKLAKKLKLQPHQTVATVLCDGGERYLQTTFNAEWQTKQGLVPVHTGTDLSFIGDGRDPGDVQGDGQARLAAAGVALSKL